MGQYRLSRSVEASIIDFLTAELVADGWSGIRVEKSFAEVYEGNLACILVNVSTRPDKRREIGSSALFNYINIEIRIFAENDGQRLDLADWMLPKLMDGINYYEYAITNGEVSEKTLSGRFNVLEIIQNRKELVNIENLEKEDKHRHLLSLRCRISLT